MRLLGQPDDLEFLGCGVSHSPSPNPRACFRERPQFERLFGDHLLQLLGLTPQLLDLIGGAALAVSPESRRLPASRAIGPYG